MPDLDLTALYDRVPALVLVIFRLAGLMVWGPLYGSTALPARVKVYAVLVLGLAVFPLIEREHLASAGLNRLDLWVLAPLVVAETMIGMVVGFVAGLPLLGIQLGGLLIGQQMGLGLARFFNPDVDDEADVLSTLLHFMIVGSFLLVGGHEALLRAVLASFEHVPLGGFRPDGDLLALFGGLLAAAFETSLRVAAPLLALVFLETVAMGFVAKTVPQLNILSLGFPLRILLGLLVVVLGLVAIDQVVMEGIDEAIEALNGYLGQQE